MLDGSFILATSAIRLITVVPARLLGLTLAKVTLNSLIHPSIHLTSLLLVQRFSQDRHNVLSFSDSLVPGLWKKDWQPLGFTEL